MRDVYFGNLIFLQRFLQSRKVVMKKSQRKVLSERFVLVGLQLALFAVVVATSSGFNDTHFFGCPEACDCDKAQHIVDCGYRSLVRSPHDVPLTARHYSVAGNRIYSISADSLVGLDELLSLDLSENFISLLPYDLFSSTPQLCVVRLNGNRFESIPATSLSRLNNLQQLFLSRNKILTPSAETEFISPSLLTLDLNGNKIVEVPDLFLDRFPQLRDLQLSKNHLTSLQMEKLTGHTHGLETLDVSSNSIHMITCNDVVYYNLTVLNANNNLLRSVDASWFVAMPNLHVLKLCANLFGSVANNTFNHATSLRQLVLCNLSNMHYIDADSFAGLSLLEKLDLSSNYNLSSIHHDAFTSLYNLQHLSVRNNRLRSLQPFTAGSNLRDVNVYMAGTQWLCDCHLKWIYEAHVNQGCNIGHDIVCAAPPELHDIPLFDVKECKFSCEMSERHHCVDHIVSVHLGTTVVLHCPVEVLPESLVVWTTSRGVVIESAVFHSNSDQFPSSTDQFRYFVSNRSANISEKLLAGHYTGGHFNLLKNGSLIVKDATRADTGRYICTVVNSHGNFTLVTELRLDYSYLSFVMACSVFVGGSSAFGFSLIAVVIGTVRLIAYHCSSDERKKRRSLRELLSQMRSSSQFDRFSAYRAAQMDRLSAFKSSTMDQLSSFTTTRIGRLRRYKQSTVSCVLHHLERMREHYSIQMDHIKESYSLNTDRLRHSYMARFRDNRSMSVCKQYRASVARARDYTNEQVARLREQYKQQQQYLLKLLELIDVGSCVSSSVEAECIRAESAIFDATVEFDEEARPSYASRPDDRGLFASSSSLPDDCRNCTLPVVSPSSVDFCDASDDVAVAVRSTSAPSMQVTELSATDCASPLGHMCCNSASVCGQKVLSSPAVASAVIAAVVVTDESSTML